MGFNTLIIFFIGMIALYSYLFFKIPKGMYKYIALFGIIINIIFIIPYSYFDSHIQRDIPSDLEYIRANENSLILSSLEPHLMSDDRKHLIAWMNIDDKYIQIRRSIEGCIIVNNTGGDNVARFTIKDADISKKIYIPDNFYGEVCEIFTNTTIQREMFLGFKCNDCSVGNPLRIYLDQNSGQVRHIDVKSDLTFESELEHPYFMYLRVRQLPVGILDTFFWLYFIINLVMIFSYGAKMLIAGVEDLFEGL